MSDDPGIIVLHSPNIEDRQSRNSSREPSSLTFGGEDVSVIETDEEFKTDLNIDQLGRFPSRSLSNYTHLLAPKQTQEFRDLEEIKEDLRLASTRNLQLFTSENFSGLPPILDELEMGLSSIARNKTQEFIISIEEEGCANFPERLLPYALLKTCFTHESFRMLDKKLESKNPYYLLDVEAFSSDKDEMLDNGLKKLASLIANFPLEGQLSPSFWLPRGDSSLKEAQIPSSAVYCCYAYPLDIQWKSEEVHDEEEMKNLEYLSELFFLMAGGYIYFDQTFRVVKVCAVQSTSKLEHQLNIDDEVPGIMHFSLPSEFPPEYIDSLVRSDRLKPVRFKKMREAGAHSFAWIAPNEEFTDVDRVRRNFGTLGGFLFLFHELYERDSSLTSKNKFFAVLSGSGEQENRHADEFIQEVPTTVEMDIVGPSSLDSDEEDTNADASGSWMSPGCGGSELPSGSQGVYVNDKATGDRVRSFSSGDKMLVSSPENDTLSVHANKKNNWSFSSSRKGNALSSPPLLIGGSCSGKYSTASLLTPETIRSEFKTSLPDLAERESMKATTGIWDQVDVNRWDEEDPIMKQVQRPGRVKMKRNDHYSRLAWEVVKGLQDKYVFAMQKDATVEFQITMSRPWEFALRYNNSTGEFIVSKVQESLSRSLAEGCVLLECNGKPLSGLTKEQGNNILKYEEETVILKFSGLSEELKELDIIQDDSENTKEGDQYIDKHTGVIIKRALGIFIATLQQNALGYILNMLDEEDLEAKKDKAKDYVFLSYRLIVLDDVENYKDGLSTWLEKIRKYTRHLLQKSMTVHDIEPRNRIAAILHRDLKEGEGIDEMVERACGREWFDTLLKRVVEQLQNQIIERQDFKNLVEYLDREMIVRETLKRLKYARLPDAEVKAIVEARARERHWLKKRKLLQLLEQALAKAITPLFQQRDITEHVLWTYQIGQIPEEILDFVEIGEQPIPTFQYLNSDDSAFNDDLVMIPISSWSGKKTSGSSEMTIAFFIDYIGTDEALVQINCADTRSKSKELHVPLHQVQRKFTWWCWRCKNSAPSNWRDIYEKKNWVCCMTCGLVTTKTMSRFSGQAESQYVKRWTVMRATYGRVYAGYDNQRNIAVAIKTCDKSIIEQKNLPENPIKELDYHSGICRLSMEERPIGILAYVDHVVTSDSVDIILEWANGGELWQHVMDFFRKKPSIEKRRGEELQRWKLQIRQLFKEICLGLKFLHDSGFAHRDLSLENVLLIRELPRKPSFLGELGKAKETKLSKCYDRYGKRGLKRSIRKLCPAEEEKDEKLIEKNVRSYIKWRRREKVYKAKICDFGVMERIPSNGRFNDRVGKRRYMSPECANSSYDGKKNDVHCLGIMLLTMLIGKHVIGKVNDANYQWLSYKDSSRKQLVYRSIPSAKELELVSNDAWKVLGRIFTKEADRASVTDLLEMDFCRKVSV